MNFVIYEKFRDKNNSLSYFIKEIVYLQPGLEKSSSNLLRGK